MVCMHCTIDMYILNLMLTSLHRLALPLHGMTSFIASPIVACHSQAIKFFEAQSS